MGHSFPEGIYSQPEDNLMHFIETNPECIRIYQDYCQANPWAKNTPAPQIHDILSACTNLWMGKIVSQFYWNMPIEQIIGEIKSGRPVVLSGDFERPGKTPLAHIVVLTGFNDETKEVCYDDPYGKTYEWSPYVSGNDTWVSWDLFIRDIKEPGNTEQKWAHTFFSA